MGLPGDQSSIYQKNFRIIPGNLTLEFIYFVIVFLDNNISLLDNITCKAGKSKLIYFICIF